MIDIDSLPNLAGIYKWTNLVNGKVYIGKSWNIRKRTLRHIYTARSLNIELELIHKAIKKYGVENFKVQAIEVYPSDGAIIDELLLNREAFWISLYESYSKDRGYNVCRYGVSRKNIEVSEETRKKLSKIGKGKTHSEETKKKMSIAKKGKFTKEKASWYGRKHSEETRQKMKMNCHQKGKPLCEKNKLAIFKSIAIEVLQIDLEDGRVIQEFESIKKAGLAMSETWNAPSKISNCIKGKRESAFGFAWAYKNKKDGNRKRKPTKGGRKCVIDQIDMNTNKVIKTWNSIQEAATSLSIWRRTILKALKGEIRHAGGFSWKRNDACPHKMQTKIRDAQSRLVKYDQRI